MKKIYTTLFAVFTLALVLAPAATHAQAPEPLGDDFIFFVEGTNPRIVDRTAQVVEDPAADVEDNQVLFFQPNNFGNPWLAWEQDIGVDMTENVDNDTLFMRLRLSEANATDTDTANVSIMLLDTGNDNGNGDPTDDNIGFRLTWDIPGELMDSEWHDVAIPLPPETYAELEAAKGDTTVSGEPLPEDEQLSDYAKRWTYSGGYNADGARFVADPSDELWEEFSWDAVWNLGVFWDQASGPLGPIYMDDLYIGGPNTDLSPATEPPDAYSGALTTSTDGSVATVNLTPVDGAGGYKVYVSADPITEESLNQPGETILVSEFGADAEDLSASFELAQLHPSVEAPEIYFGVTTISNFGFESEVPTTTSVQVTDARQRGWVPQISADEVNGVIDILSTGDDLPEEPWSLNDDAAFEMGYQEGQTIDSEVESESDLTARAWMAFAPDPEDEASTLIFIYADVTDSELFLAPGDGSGSIDASASPAFHYDDLNVAWGKYQVQSIVGSTHQGLAQGGPDPDYIPRLNALTDDTGDISGVNSAIGSAGSAPLPELGTKAVYKFDDSDNVVGYRMLVVYFASDIYVEPAEGEDPTGEFVRPAEDEVLIYPLRFVVEDQDGAPTATDWFATRTGALSGWRPNTTAGSPGWYARPAEWTPVAFSGINVNTAAEDKPAPRQFALGQNYPNPVGREHTRIGFTLPQASTVNLSVYNVLGQRVAQIAHDEHLTAGTHKVGFDASRLSAGVYFYRIDTGTHRATRRMVVVK